jgi:hypothetical protein
MKRVLPLEIMRTYRNGIIHVILKEDYKDSLNKEMPRIAGEALSEKNPSRGFFSTGSYIEDNILTNLTAAQKGEILTINDIAYRMGVGYATLFVHAEMYPFDVEYCLGEVDGLINLVIIDFGMCEFIDYSESIESICKKLLYGNMKTVGGLYDLYFPSTEDSTFPSFIEGIKFVKSKLTDEKKKGLIDAVISGWN